MKRYPQWAVELSLQLQEGGPPLVMPVHHWWSPRDLSAPLPAIATKAHRHIWINYCIIFGLMQAFLHYVVSIYLRVSSRKTQQKVLSRVTTSNSASAAWQNQLGVFLLLFYFFFIFYFLLVVHVFLKISALDLTWAGWADSAMGHPCINAVQRNSHISATSSA